MPKFINTQRMQLRLKLGRNVSYFNKFGKLAILVNAAVNFRYNQLKSDGAVYSSLCSEHLYKQVIKLNPIW